MCHLSAHPVFPLTSKGNQLLLQGWAIPDRELFHRLLGLVKLGGGDDGPQSFQVPLQRLSQIGDHRFGQFLQRKDSRL